MLQEELTRQLINVISEIETSELTKETKLSVEFAPALGSREVWIWLLPQLEWHHKTFEQLKLNIM